ncbi:MAG: hypothetical protein RH942_00490 [Kiloniellaceae bacterium]
MSVSREEARQKLERLADALCRDIDHMSDAELLREVVDDFSNPEQTALDIKRQVGQLVSEFGRKRLVDARRGYEAATSGAMQRSHALSLERKRELVERFAASDSDLREKLTMAARNQEDFESDIDSFIEDLIELGVIDREGNIS